MKLYIGVYVKYALFLLDFSETWTFPIYFQKILQYET